MITILSTVISILAFRFRPRASLELGLIGLRHQVSVLRRQHPLNAMVLVKPATVVQWHRKGFRIYWRWQSRSAGRPKMASEIRGLIRQMSRANPLWGAP